MRGTPKTIAAAAFLGLAACAHSPDGIQAVYVSPASYAQWTCPTLADEQARVAARLAEDSKAQQNAHDGDLIGVALLGLPVGSWSNGDHTTDIAYLKGQAEALKAVSAKCSG